MKRKFFSILMATMLVLSLGVIPAVSVGADFPNAGYTLVTSGNSTATWDTDADTGIYSVKLVNVDARIYLEFIPEPGIKMSDLATIGTTGFRNKAIGGPPLSQPCMELRFTMDGYVDSDPWKGHADVNITNWDYTGQWETEDATANNRVYTYGNDPVDGTSFNNDGAGNWTTLALTPAAIDAMPEMVGASAADWELTRVRIDVWDAGGTCYIDDITIDGTTYELEPLTVDVTGPAEDVYVCEDFEVTTTIKNRGDEATEFKAIIDPGDNAEWVSGGLADLSDHPQYEAVVQPSETWTVSWMLHCTDPNPTTVTVKAKSKEYPAWIENTFTVTQVAPELDVAITAIDAQLVGENFVVTATVTSTGPNTNVVATIDPDTAGTDAEWISGGDADQTGYPITIGNMVDAQEEVVTWTLRCTTAATASVEVTATSTEDSAVDTEDVAQTTPLHPILTAYEAVTVVPEDPFHPGQTFSVDAIITNNGDEPALDCSATISFSNELVELVTGDDAEKDLGDIQPDAGHHANWTVICNAAGYTTITVTPAGDDDVTGESIVADDLISGSVLVEQIPIDELTVSISSPVDGAKYGPTQTFHVTGTATNTGASPIEGATVTIVIGGGGNASVTATGPVGPSDLNTGDTIAFDWTVECDGIDVPPAYTTFTVNASGTSEKTGEPVEGTDDTWVYQKYLVVDIDIPEVTEFCVDADIIIGFDVTNYYTNVLSNVRAAITLTGPAHLVGGWPAELDLDPLLVGVTDSVEAGWHINCDGPGAVTINVFVSGIHLTTTIDNEDEITIYQYAGADLDVVSEPETCQWVGYGETFVVTGTVTNNGDATASGVTADLSTDVVGEAVGTGDASTAVFYLDYPPIEATSETIKVDEVSQTRDADYTIDNDTGKITFLGGHIPAADADITADYTNVGIEIVTGADPQTIGTGTLLAGGSGTATWTVQCTSFCDVPITIIADGTDICGDVTGSNLEIVHQLPLEVVVVSQQPVETCTTFCVTAKIWNRTCECGEVAPFDVTGVTATITFDPTSGASLVTQEDATKTIGTVYRCQSQEVEWTVHCDSIGDVDITVTAQTSTNPSTGDPLGYEVSTSDFITVEQIRSLIRYDVPLAKGWNYMSLPLIPEDNDIADVLAPIALQYNNVWSYVAGEWKLYAPSVPITEFTEMNDGVGYVIRAINPVVLTGQGYELPTLPYVLPPEYDLELGWNLTGFKTMDFVDPVGEITNADTMGARLYLGNLQVSGGETRIIGDEARFFRTYLPGIGWRVLTDSNLMLVGKGYWLYVSLADLSIVPPIER